MSSQMATQQGVQKLVLTWHKTKDTLTFTNIVSTIITHVNGVNYGTDVLTMPVTVRATAFEGSELSRGE